eukprot:scaffold358_cov256-Pinguiococcus_pyrenoidosus.AAC.36
MCQWVSAKIVKESDHWWRLKGNFKEYLNRNGVAIYSGEIQTDHDADREDLPMTSLHLQAVVEAASWRACVSVPAPSTPCFLEFLSSSSLLLLLLLFFILLNMNIA